MENMTDEDFFLAIECIMSVARLDRSEATDILHTLSRNQFSVLRTNRLNVYKMAFADQYPVEGSML